MFNYQFPYLKIENNKEIVDLKVKISSIVKIGQYLQKILMFIVGSVLTPRW